MARFFLPGVAVSNEVTIVADDAKHIARSLRMQPGETIEVVIAGQAYQAELQTVSAEVVTATLAQRLSDSESPLEIYLYQALPKGDKMELIIQKATELGVKEVIPLLSARVVVKWRHSAGEQRLQRWQRIAEEAAKQSRRSTIPTIRQPLPLRELPPDSGRLRLVAWEEAKQPLADLLTQHQPQAVEVVVGPEGGLDWDEAEFLAGIGFQSVSLGPRILRTETAPLALLSVLQYQWGDLGGRTTCQR
ncbi:MAG: 16S rRNA (uracil(1498)-N(3))-methyltransferase [Bacillota bacterium]|jgi:16S rRNA (uracil1498-N3)-methyltransferase